MLGYLLWPKTQRKMGVLRAVKTNKQMVRKMNETSGKIYNILLRISVKTTKTKGKRLGTERFLESKLCKYI